MKKILIMSSAVLILLVGSTYLLNELSNSRSFQFFGEIVTNIETDEKVVALTFDDGPAVHTDEILHILKEANIPTTFFLTGQEIEAHMDKAMSIAAHGHEIGNHSFSHRRMVFKTPSFIADEIERTDERIRQTGYEGDIHFRPPNGKKLVLLPHYLHQHDRKTIMWNMEPETDLGFDAKANEITEHVIEHVEPGSIILLHVMYESRIEALHAVEDIITSLHEQGYTFVTVSELLEYRKNQTPGY